MRHILTRVSRLLFCLACLSSLAFGQVIIPNVNDTRVGGQLIFYFDMASYDVGFLTITNTGLSTVPLHIQLQSSDCQEILNFRISLSAGCLKIYDLRRFELSGGQSLDLGGLRGFMTVTPITPSPATAAVPYNHLAGNSVFAHLGRKNSFGLNAVARLAVDAAGVPLADFAGVLDGATRRFQNIQPSKLYNDGFFALDNLTDSRMILISFTDNYPANGYFVSSGGTTDVPVELRGFANNSSCARLSLANRTFTCILDISMESYLGAAVGAFRQDVGFLELNISYLANQNLVGIASQTLGTFTVNRYLWGK